LFSSLCLKVTVFGKNCSEIFWTTTSPYPVSLGVMDLDPS
jgi:hypothetical protein